MCGVVSVDGAQFGVWHHAHAAVLFPRRARRFARCFGASRALRHTCRAESRGRVVEVERGAGSQGDVRTRAVCALSHALERSHPGIALDERGYTRSFTGNLVSSVEVSDFEANLAQGSGDELAGKIRAPYSSSALAVNCFAPFKRNLRRPASVRRRGGLIAPLRGEVSHGASRHAAQSGRPGRARRPCRCHRVQMHWSTCRATRRGVRLRRTSMESATLGATPPGTASSCASSTRRGRTAGSTPRSSSSTHSG